MKKILLMMVNGSYNAFSITDGRLIKDNIDFSINDGRLIKVIMPFQLMMVDWSYINDGRWKRSATEVFDLYIHISTESEHAI